MAWWAVIIAMVLHLATCVQDYAYVAVILSYDFKHMILWGFFSQNKLQNGVVT